MRQPLVPPPPCSDSCECEVTLVVLPEGFRCSSCLSLPSHVAAYSGGPTTWPTSSPPCSHHERSVHTLTTGGPRGQSVMHCCAASHWASYFLSQLPRPPDSRAAFIESLKRYVWACVCRRIWHNAEFWVFFRNMFYHMFVLFIKYRLKISCFENFFDSEY